MTLSDEVVKEVLGRIRALGTIRFIYLPLFLGGSAALAKEFLTRRDGIACRDHLAWAGWSFALLMGAIEIILSRNLVSLWNALKEITGRRSMWSAVRADRNCLLLLLTRLILFAPYPAVAGYWASWIWCRQVGPAILWWSLAGTAAALLAWESAYCSWWSRKLNTLWRWSRALLGKVWARPPRPS